MQCPHCNTTLAIAERHGVEIDYCPKCRGVWLDRGELDKIIDKAAANEESAKMPPPDTGYQSKGDNPPGGYYKDQQYGHKKPYKKKGFLSDFFDFD